MAAKKGASRRSLKSDLKRVDAHVTKAREYDELPEVTSEMLARATVSRGGRPCQQTLGGSSPFAFLRT